MSSLRKGAGRMDSIVQSLRIRQWLKNVVVLAPLVFSGQLSDWPSVVRACLAMISLCLASSGGYLINDVLDRRIDRFHPIKKSRPVASGALPVWSAWLLALVLMSGSVWLATQVHPKLGAVVLGYMALSLAYSLFFKRVVILDALMLSIGFVVRIWAGAVVLDLVPSHWLQLSMFFLALFLNLAKRRQELMSLQALALRHRRVLSSYTPAFIDQLTAVLTAVSILCYALYAVSPEVTGRLGQAGFIYTVPFVIYGIFRYLYLMHVRQEALDPTEALLSDMPILLAVVAWGLSVLWILYH